MSAHISVFLQTYLCCRGTVLQGEGVNTMLKCLPNTALDVSKCGFHLRRLLARTKCVKEKQPLLGSGGRGVDTASKDQAFLTLLCCCCRSWSWCWCWSWSRSWRRRLQSRSCRKHEVLHRFAASLSLSALPSSSPGPTFVVAPGVAIVNVGPVVIVAARCDPLD